MNFWKQLTMNFWKQGVVPEVISNVEIQQDLEKPHLVKEVYKNHYKVRFLLPFYSIQVVFQIKFQHFTKK